MRKESTVIFYRRFKTFDIVLTKQGCNIECISKACFIWKAFYFVGKVFSVSMLSDNRYPNGVIFLTKYIKIYV